MHEVVMRVVAFDGQGRLFLEALEGGAHYKKEPKQVRPV
jgi:hypothetical protein